MIIIDKDLSQEQTSLLTSPLIIESVLTREEISRVLEIVDSLELAPVKFEGEAHPDKAIADRAWIPYTDDTAWLYARVYDIVEFYNAEYYHFDPIDMVERIAYTEYSEGGHLNWHMDIASSLPFSSRKLAISIQLSDSDDYREGFLEFRIDDDYRMPRTAGTFVIYPVFLNHRVSPVTQGTRKSLTFWVGGASFT